MTIALITGTRPEIIKLFPVMRIFDLKGIDYKFIHTGQHYDYNLSSKFFEEFRIREPDYTVALATLSNPVEQVSRIMAGLDNIFQQFTPSLMLVQGDTNSVFAAANAAMKLNIPIAHLEAGLRNEDWKRPEELNRRLVDHMSDVLFAPTPKSASNLKDERVNGEIYVVGNTSMDSVRLCMQFNSTNSEIKRFRERMRLTENFDDSVDFVLVTLHRSDHVDNPEFLKQVLSALSVSGHKYIFPVHPRTLKRIHEFELERLIPSSINVIDPIGYADFLKLLKMCEFVITDSGGVQEEICSPLINKRGIVLHHTTERPESLESGHTILCKTYTQQEILEAIGKIQEKKTLTSNISPYGSGFAAEKMVEILEGKYSIVLR